MKIEMTIVAEEDEDDDTYGLCSVTVASHPVTVEEGFKSHIIRSLNKNK